MEMNKATAKKLLNEVVAGKSKESLESVLVFCSNSGTTLVDLLNISNIEKAIESGVIKAPKPTNETKEMTPTERVLLAKKEREEETATNRTIFEGMNTLLGANTFDRPEVLYRLTWKEGRKWKGMDVLHAYPIADNNQLMLIGVMLEQDAELNVFYQINNLMTLTASNIVFNGKKAIVKDSNSNYIDINIELLVELPAEEIVQPVQEEPKAEKPKVKRVRKPKSEIVQPPLELVENKEEGMEEGK